MVIYNIASLIPAAILVLFSASMYFFADVSQPLAEQIFRLLRLLFFSHENNEFHVYLKHAMTAEMFPRLSPWVRAWSKK